MRASEPRGSRPPVRTCVGCRASRPVDELVRLTLASGVVVIDGPSSGRGAWLCRADAATTSLVVAGCLEVALQRRSLDRAWRVRTSADDERAIRDLVGGASG